MKNIIYLLVLVFVILSCKEKTKDYVMLSGTIANKNSDSLRVHSENYDKNYSFG